MKIIIVFFSIFPNYNVFFFRDYISNTPLLETTGRL